MNMNSDTETYEKSPGALGFVFIPDEETDGAKKYVRYDAFVALLFKQETPKEMAMHAALGVCGEAGELGDAIKKQHVYNNPSNRENIVEELGDLRFYIQAVMQLYNISEQEVLQTNALKLLDRYVSMSYSDERAIARRDKL